MSKDKEKLSRPSWMLEEPTNFFLGSGHSRQQKQLKRPEPTMVRPNPIYLPQKPSAALQKGASDWQKQKVKRILEQFEQDSNGNDKEALEKLAKDRFDDLQTFWDILKSVDYEKWKKFTGDSGSVKRGFKRPFNQNETKYGSTTEILPQFDASGKLIDIGKLTHEESEPKKNKKEIEKSLQQKESEMSVLEMLKQEKMNSHQADREFAKRIKSDKRFENDLEYLDNESDKFGKTKHKTEKEKRAHGVNLYNREQQKLDQCLYCLHSDKQTACPIVSAGTKVYLGLPLEQPLVRKHCYIIPIQHHRSLLECDDEEWLEIRNYQKCLLQLFHQQNQGVLFMETCIQFRNYRHAFMECIPLPYQQYDSAPAYFKESILQIGEEWSQNKKLIDTSKKGFKQSLVKEIPYFHLWLGLEPKYGHVIEEDNFSPTFAREVIGGILDLDTRLCKKPRKLSDEELLDMLKRFKKEYQHFDWTSALQ